MYCPGCGAENFYDQESLQHSGGASPSCWACGKAVSLPFRIRLGRAVIMLNHDSRLYPHHVDPGQSYVFNHPVAEVSRNPRNLQQWGLKNLGTSKWTLVGSDGTVLDVEPGRNAPLSDGARINFGNLEGVVRF
jgi:hypothetical protein